jgi:hypothetical protein
LNINKRQYKNDHEHLVTVAPLSLLTGLVLPIETMGLLAIYIVGRYYYTKGYIEKEGAMNK